MSLTLALALCAALSDDADFAKAQVHMEAFEYDAAAPLLEGLAKRADLAGPDKAQVLVLLGISYAELRDDARAALAFEDAVIADPLIVLPKDASPKIKGLLEDARARVRLRGAASPPKPPPVTTPDPTPPATTDPPATAAGGESPLPLAAAITAGVGGGVLLVGGIVWGVGLVLRQQAIDEPFQSVAKEKLDQSAAAQVGGQVVTIVGAMALVAGGALFAFSMVE